MEFTRDELSRLLVSLENELRTQADMKKNLEKTFSGVVDFVTPLFTMYSNLLKAYYDGDRILHIGIKD